MDGKKMSNVKRKHLQLGSCWTMPILAEKTRKSGKLYAKLNWRIEGHLLVS